MKTNSETTIDKDLIYLSLLGNNKRIRPPIIGDHINTDRMGILKIIKYY